MKEKTQFIVDKDKCSDCGRCVNVCAGMVLEQTEDGCPEMKEFERYRKPESCWASRRITICG